MWIFNKLLFAFCNLHILIIHDYVILRDKLKFQTNKLIYKYVFFENLKNNKTINPQAWAIATTKNT